MKIAGKKIEGPNVEVLVIPRPSGERPKVDESGRPVWRTGNDGQPLTGPGGVSLDELHSKGSPEEREVLLLTYAQVEEFNADLIFKAKAVLSHDKFFALMPEEKPPMIKRRGSNQDVPDFDDLKYKERQRRRNELQSQWMIIESLSATPDLEWETIKANDPDSWNNLMKEFQDAGLATSEVTRIIQMVMSVNGLDSEKFDEARKRFLLTQANRNGR